MGTVYGKCKKEGKDRFLQVIFNVNLAAVFAV